LERFHLFPQFRVVCNRLNLIDDDWSINKGHYYNAQTEMPNFGCSGYRRLQLPRATPPIVIFIILEQKITKYRIEQLNANYGFAYNVVITIVNTCPIGVLIRRLLVAPGKGSYC